MGGAWVNSLSYADDMVLYDLSILRHSEGKSSSVQDFFIICMEILTLSRERCIRGQHHFVHFSRRYTLP